MNNALRDFGFDAGWAAVFAGPRQGGLDGSEVPARVLEERRGLYRIARSSEGGEALIEEAELSGKLRKDSGSSALLPAVGDWVFVLPNPSGRAQVRGVAPRRSAFVRKAPGDTGHDRVEAQVVAANVDLALIVCAAGHDWNERRIERYVALAKSSGALAFLAITKADLSDDCDSLVGRARVAAPGIGSALVCAPAGRGLPELAAAIKAASGGGSPSVVLLGSSGAGKSTLLNALAGEELAAAGSVREDDQRGRHTTTHRQLYRLGSGPAAGALMIDTPGMRELQLWADEGEVSSAFPEIEALAENCRFRDCAHDGEPGCAVRAALESGELEAGRYESWRKMTKEVAFLRTREDHAAKEAERRRWKSIAMSQRAYAKAERRGAAK
jgi:ribosome small subunit-dependent GTPase A